VSGYGLDDRAISAEGKDFSSILCVQTGSGAHPASCTVGTGVPFPGAKARPGRDADHLPHLVPRLIMSRSYTPLPPNAFLACSETTLGAIIPLSHTFLCDALHRSETRGLIALTIVAVLSPEEGSRIRFRNIVITILRR
jgi:hypothetical protein